MASMETLDGVVSLDNLVVVSQELEPYVLSLQTGPEEDGEMEVVVLAVMKRQAGVLVALPTDVLLEETLDRGNSGDQDLLFGPSTVVEVPSVFQNNGVITSTGGRVSVVIVDCLPDILSSMRELIPGEPIIFGFDEQMPMALPSPDALLTEAVKWISAATSDRVAYYTPEEEEAEEAKIPQLPVKKIVLKPAAKAGSGTPKEKTKPRKATTSSLAADLESLKSAIPNLVAQVDALHSRLGQGEAAQLGGGLSKPLSASLSVPQVSAPLSAIAKGLAAPPRTQTRGSPGMLGSPFLTPGKPGEIQELEQEKQDALEGYGQTSDNALAMAVLEQSKALTSLVAQISSASQDPMADLLHGSSGSTRGSIGRARLQAELAAQRGTFFTDVLQQISRRMSPTSSPDVSPQVMLDRGISGVKYLERFGGFARQRELGQLQFQIMGILDNLMAENIEAVKDGVALLAVTVDQACMDSGRMDLATLLCLQEDAPSSIYVNRHLSSTSRARSFTPLASQKWITVALAYLKEIDVISVKRNEMLGARPSGAASSDDPAPKVKPKPGPKKKWRPKQGGGAAEEEE